MEHPDTADCSPILKLKVRVVRLRLAGPVRAEDCINLTTHENGDARQVKPQHQANHCSETPIHGAIVAEVRHVDSKADRGECNERGAGYIAGRYKSERHAHIGPKPIDNCETQQQRGADDDPA